MGVVSLTVSVSGWFLTDAELKQLDLSKLDPGDRVVDLAAPITAADRPGSPSAQGARPAQSAR